ncbi:uncharacterized protein V1510DRAFT_422257 [Dipodascopsis tothii]|uniref:uncharacterized protein n=1 Tax=Dipodascopsis tothii TaxID=44089 RepID=UPI0034D02230
MTLISPTRHLLALPLIVGAASATKLISVSRAVHTRCMGCVLETYCPAFCICHVLHFPDYKKWVSLLSGIPPTRRLTVG